MRNLGLLLRGSQDRVVSKRVGFGGRFPGINQQGLEVCYCLWGCHPDLRLGPILGPSRSHPGSQVVPFRFAMCFVLQSFGSIQVPRWGATPARPGPILVPSVPSRIGPGRAETDFLATSESKTGTRVHLDVPRYQKPERGYMRRFPGTRNRNEGTFAKTALLRSRPELFPLELECTPNCCPCSDTVRRMNRRTFFERKGF